MLKVIFLVFIACLEYIISSNNYFLEKECTKNPEDSLIECSLIFSEDNLSRLKSPFLQNNQKIDYKKLIKKLKFEARILEGGAIHIKITDSENKRYEIPRNAIDYFEKNT